MAADASIYSLIKPQAQVSGPLDQYGDALKLKSLMGAQGLQDLQMRQAQQGLDDDQATRQFYNNMPAGADIRSKIGDLIRVNPKAGLALSDHFQKQDKTAAEMEKLKAETGRLGIETTVKAMDFHRNDLANINTPADAAQWVMAAYNNPHLSQLAQRAGSPQEAIGRIPTDPAGFAEWKQKNALGMTKFIELNKPTIHNVDSGGVITEKAYPGLGGAPSVVGTTAKTQTPDSIASNATTRRGQNMTDARAKQTLEQGRWSNDLERGIQVNMGTGATRPITTGGVPLDAKDKPLTESQGKAAMFGMRARLASDILDSIGADGKVQPGVIKRMAESVPFAGEGMGTSFNWTQSSPQQQVEQAQRDFVNAVLRPESGASISESEFQNAKKQYFPQPGDSAAVVAQKKTNRETEIAGLAVMAGPGAKHIKSAPQPATQATSGKIGGGVLSPNPDGSFRYGR